MKNDPIVQEIRKIRHRIERECQYDPEKYFQRLQTSQEKLVERLVCRKPKPLIRADQKKAS